MSISGYCIYVDANIIPWSSRKQIIMASSSTELKYHALANGAAKFAWIQSFLSEFKILLPRTPIFWCDNTGANCLVSNPIFHAYIKNIEINVHFVQDWVIMK